MPLFGEKQDHSADDQAARAKVEWACSAPVADLAAELVSAFRSRRDRDMRDLVNWLLFPRRPELQNTRDVKRVVGSTEELERDLLEAIQLLEHAELILGVENHVTGYDHRHRWRATRLGLEAVNNGKDVVRQRIKDRTGL